ncbi:aminopeptidase N [Boudabousia marimammalium]|uniref:Aminopeptidase N n=1 Tax=Boudabousia marimammalium TaxID=156892 RepID=A0A1Q5PR61_9ACTO|nr:aminopeptidase N [Boudabousia marimammalium]OKL49983.1 aminopeptidase N [Boudabousia marimammalium]
MTLTRIEAASRHETLQVDTYSIKLDLSGAKQKDTFLSSSTVTFFSTTEETFIDITADEIISLEINGTPSSIEISDSKLKLTGLDTHNPNTVTVVANCIYSTSGEGLHRYHDPEDGRFYLYTQYEPFDAHRVYACFDQPDLKGKWSFSIIAPEDWIVLSNQPEIATDAGEGIVQHHYAQTPPLSSYITCVVAGEYAKVDGESWTGECEGTALEIPLALYCRQSLLPHLDHYDIFKVTKNGFDFFHREYQFPYPWGKYDQIFVPEYNLGAMENPGCVTFTESYIVRGGATRTQRARRGNIILHEMCHMWFGDLATPAWWDDLWLKESFADHQGTFAEAAASEYSDAWTSFAISRKGWAYIQDQRPSTHPIMADIPDLDAAKQNFDGITYAKGASVLKQLMAYVGEEAFFKAAQQYFAEKAFTATNFNDLISVLEKTTGMDLQGWVDSWLKTSGPSVITCRRNHHQLTLTQHVPDLPGVTGGVVRPHRFRLDEYGVHDGAFTLINSRPVLLDQESLTVEHTEADSMILIPNADDATYGVFRLDEQSLAGLEEHMSEIPDSLTRAVAWQSLWLAVYDGELDPTQFVKLVARHAANETNLGLFEACLRYASSAVERFMSQAQRELASAMLHDASIQALGREIEPDFKKAWFDIRVELASSDMSENETEWLLQQASDSDGLLPAQVWAAIIALARAGKITEKQILKLEEWDRSGEGEILRQTALSSIPSSTVKQRAWHAVHHAALSNDFLTATLTGMNRASHGDLMLDFEQDFFRQVRDYWESHSIVMGTRYVLAAYPKRVSITDAPGSQWERHPVIVSSDKWLFENEDASHALRRLIIELRDDTRRNLAVQEAFNG